MTIQGFSRAADAVFFHIKEMDLALDAGLCCGRQPKLVLLTHGHSDHSRDITFMCRKENGANVWLPNAIVPKVHACCKAVSTMQ